MTGDDQPPEGDGVIYVSRDTLLLVGALGFLILAIVLTFQFSPSGRTENTFRAAVATSVAEQLTATAVWGFAAPGAALTAQIGAYPQPGMIATPAPGLPGGTAPAAGGAAYPGNAATSISQSPLATTPFSPTIGAGPTGAGEPAATSATGPAGPGGAPAGAANEQVYPGPGGPSPTLDPAYPGPVGDGTPPPLPTFNPTVIVPTAARATPSPVIPTLPPARPAATPAPPGQPPLAPTPDAPKGPPAGQPDTATAVPDDLALDTTPTLAAPTATPGPPPPPPADVLSGQVRWGIGQSPIVLTRDVQLAPGAELVIEPGVTVLLGPGVSIYVDGAQLLALGRPEQPVRFLANTAVRWSGIFGRPNSYLVLEHVEIRGGGAGGTLLAVERSELIARAALITDNGGGILLTDTKTELAGSEIAGNDVPFGPALLATYGRGGFFTLDDTRIGGNRISDLSPQVRLINTSTFETLNLALEGNLIRGGVPNLELVTAGPVQGALVCNTLIGDQQGFGLRSSIQQVDPLGQTPLQLQVANNIIDEHTPPIIPVYLEYGIGRGAISEVLLDMRGNWWGHPTGPYAPELNPLGRGDSVGVNIFFEPWLAAPPECAPLQ